MGGKSLLACATKLAIILSTSFALFCSTSRSFDTFMLTVLMVVGDGGLTKIFWLFGWVYINTYMQYTVVRWIGLRKFQLLSLLLVFIHSNA